MLIKLKLEKVTQRPEKIMRKRKKREKVLVERSAQKKRLRDKLPSESSSKMKRER